MKKVALLIETSRSFGRQLIMGIAGYSKLHGPWSFYKEPTDIKSSMPHLANWKPDGIIARDFLISDELLQLNIPVIVSVHKAKIPEKLPIIKTDNQAVAKMASEHFLEKGLKNLAFCGYDHFYWSNERGSYFSSFNNEAGYQTYDYRQKEALIKSKWEVEQQLVSDWINGLPKPVGIFACNDDRAQHILEVCKILNLKVPEDVSVVGVDNDPLICNLSDPPLSSIVLNNKLAGYKAAELLDKMINKKTVAVENIIVSPSHIIQRQSSDGLAINDPDVSQAIFYIRQNAKNKILVNDVVKSTKLNRRTLERRFKQQINRTIYEEIRRARIELISKMLIETNMSITEISSFFNFTDTEHISRYFKLEKRIGPRQFRKLYRP
ncbi:MAG: DNA-binding transcriptional regulator [Calditrichaceae bacterium]|nr:DNA-binding transcriptional regulator [Calditrichaceae bacterium]HES59706.1 DNA-binding transcriptional regulator [Caldithrix sp.]